MNLEKLNQLNEAEAKDLFLEFCHCLNWALDMTEGRPYFTIGTLKSRAKESWDQLNDTDWLEAFAAHAQLGDIESLNGKFSNTQEVSKSEQSIISTADAETLKSLLEKNHEYLEKFGFIFISFATEKTAENILSEISTRINNTKEQELKNASLEQRKIALNRMEVLCQKEEQ